MKVVLSEVFCGHSALFGDPSLLSGRICRRSLRGLNRPVIPRVANGSLIELRLSACSARVYGTICIGPGHANQTKIPVTPPGSFCLSARSTSVLPLGSLTAFGRGSRRGSTAELVPSDDGAGVGQ
ncbi:hypothetical protein CHARACLAT_023510 [Characodon lateralis]|uniref:Uncharacterized protein n=1 Tax=Characodon lateralis TaxID=208331 RepID=A0ABU7DC56_9TELE|nr:hypothetical protein [Characodon lateralis]